MLYCLVKSFQNITTFFIFFLNLSVLLGFLNCAFFLLCCFSDFSFVLGKKLRTKAPKIQRLITPRRLQRKRFRVSLKKKRAEKSKSEAAEYAKLLSQRAKEEKERKDEAKRRRSSASRSSDQGGKTTPQLSVSEKPKKTGKVPAKVCLHIGAISGSID